MSWSVSFLGEPQKVGKALYDESEKMSGQSKIEYDSALPHLVALVHENFGTSYLIKVDANGHGSSVNGEQKDRYFSATIQPIYSVLV